MDNPVEIDFTPEGEIIGSINLMYGNPRGDTLVHWQYGGAYPRYDQEAVLEEFIRTGPLLQEFHITHIRSNRGMSLSGGERRRTEIARTLATDPKFILLDEPFAGVDPISVADIKQIIQHLKDRGIGVLLTDHNVRETLDICERAYIVSEGQIIAEGDAQVIVNNPKVREVYLGEQFEI